MYASLLFVPLPSAFTLHDRSRDTQPALLALCGKGRVACLAPTRNVQEGDTTDEQRRLRAGFLVVQSTARSRAAPYRCEFLITGTWREGCAAVLGEERGMKKKKKRKRRWDCPLLACSNQPCPHRVGPLCRKMRF